MRIGAVKPDFVAPGAAGVLPRQARLHSHRMTGLSLSEMDKGAALKALETLSGSTNAAELFQGCMAAFDSPHWIVRRQAAQQLLKVGKQKGLVDALKNAYQAGSVDQRYWVMKILAQLMGTEILGWIKKTYSTTTDASLRAHAISAAAEVEGTEATEFLVHTLRDDSWLNRYAAANYIEDRGPEVLKFLQKGFTDGSGDLKYWCLRLIVQIMGPESEGTIRKGMRSEDPNMRHYVLRSMEQVEGEWCVPLLVEFLGDTNWSNRRVASDLLRARGRQAMRYLAQAADSSEQDIRYWAVRCLGETGDERAVKPLEQFLYTCDSKEEGLWALEALSRIPCASSARAIIEASYEYPEDLDTVQGYLERLGVTSLRPIIEYLDSPNQTIQQVCRRVVEKLPYPGLRALMKILEGATEEAREDLLNNLKQIHREDLERLLERDDLNMEMIQSRAANAPARAFPTMSTISVLVPQDGLPLTEEGSVEGEVPPPYQADSLSGSEEVSLPELPSKSEARASRAAPRRLSTTMYPVGLEEVLTRAVRLQASDVHLKSGLPPIFRIHGSLRRTDLPVISAEHARDFAHEVLPAAKFETFDAEGLEMDCGYDASEKIGRFRVNCYRERLGPSVAMRHIPGKVSSLADLKLPRVFRDLCFLKQGLILITGPTGAGKSTTLAALVDFINSNREEHIITVEDPVEFIHENRMSIITSRELGSHTRSFADALRAALREDPDVILIGEMRDIDTMQLAITAAETGHLVLSTLHTSSPGETVDRIINVFPAEHHPIIRISLAETLAAVVTQQLVPTVDGKRVAIRDVLVKTPAVAHLIREGKLHQVDQAIVAGRKEGMQTRDDDLQHLLKEGRVSRETAAAFCTDKKTFLGGSPGGAR